MRRYVEPAAYLPVARRLVEQVGTSRVSVLPCSCIQVCVRFPQQVYTQALSGFPGSSRCKPFTRLRIKSTADSQKQGTLAGYLSTHAF